MPSFGETSRHRLVGVHPSLTKILFEVVQMYDISIPPSGGLRTEAQQAELFASGKSKTINSKHLIQSDGYGHAVDVVPYPVDWDDSKRFFFMAGAIMMSAKRNNIKIRWGHDWDMDMDFEDQSFNDSVHFEIVV